MTEPNRLTRTEDDRMLLGVCSGLGAYFGIDPTVVRIVFVLLTVFGGSGLVLYLVLWLIVPRASKVDAAPREIVSDGVAEGRRLAHEGATAARRGYRRMRGSGPTDVGDEDGGPGRADPGSRGADTGS